MNVPGPTPEQIKNLRNLAATYFGPWAYMMPDSDVIKFRDWMQKELNELPTKEEVKKATEAHKESIKTGFTLGGLSNKIT